MYPPYFFKKDKIGKNLNELIKNCYSDLKEPYSKKTQIRRYSTLGDAKTKVPAQNITIQNEITGSNSLSIPISTNNFYFQRIRY